VDGLTAPKHPPDLKLLVPKLYKLIHHRINYVAGIVKQIENKINDRDDAFVKVIHSITHLYILIITTNACGNHSQLTMMIFHQAVNLSAYAVSVVCL